MTGYNEDLAWQRIEWGTSVLIALGIQYAFGYVVGIILGLTSSPAAISTSSLGFTMLTVLSNLLILFIVLNHRNFSQGKNIGEKIIWTIFTGLASVLIVLVAGYHVLRLQIHKLTT